MSDIKNDEDIKTLVHAFYSKVQEDERLGYVFNDYAEVDWDKHLPNMVDFWSNILFKTRRYNGRPFRQHMDLPIEKMDFGRWYNLFEQTVDDHFEGTKADYAKEMAAKIASSFSVRMEMEGKFED
ncbi:group III truncated hemoglobin [Aliifodinibius halophilus]|uniref:Group III truncated hemoglobin n=2 Tax=Fodinibius halophilus TaxID=1736908 RepID=A0A6M1TJI7_9BACT|nr:group III truncated hemoglobin [Fodinibius halophilus]